MQGKLQWIKQANNDFKDTQKRKKLDNQELPDFYTIKEKYLMQTKKAFKRISLKIVAKAKKITTIIIFHHDQRFNSQRW